MIEHYHRSFNRTRITNSDPPPGLSDAHYRMLVEGSAIAPEIIAGRGYRTVKRADVPDVFADYQRRNGLEMPLYSPDGITTGDQLRADRPRRDKRGKPIRYETPTGAEIIADVHPLMRGTAAEPSAPLWITEGIKKGDSLASRGRCAVSLIGVWMFRPKGSGAMLPCFDHVALDRRRVFVVYDSDVMHKPEVAMALERLVGDLEARGARPLVVYLPDAPDGSKQGVDDYLAAGGTVEHLEEIARPFTPADATRERLGRDAPLREKIAALWRAWSAEPFGGIGGHTRREIARAMIEDAPRKGETTARGVRVPAARRWLAERVGVSEKAIRNGLRGLEADGHIRRDRRRGRGKAPDAPAYYVLLIPSSATPEGRARGTQEGKKQGTREGRRGAEGETRREGESNPGGYPMRAPRRQAGNPLGEREYLSEIKRLRWSYVARQYDAASRGYVYEYVERLGKIAGRVLEALIDAGGEATVEELAGAVCARRARDLRRRQIARLEAAGIVAVSDAGDYVNLTDDWREKLGIARELGGEYKAEDRARKRHARARLKYKGRNKIKPDRAPTERDMDRAREARRERADGTADELRRLSPLAAAMADYLERNPRDAAQPPGWIGATLWALALYPERVTPAECRAVLAELGGEPYLRDRLRQSRAA